MTSATFIIEYLNPDGSVKSAHTISENDLIDLLHNLGACRPSEAWVLS